MWRSIARREHEKTQVHSFFLSLAKLAAIRRYEREKENEGCWAFESKAAEVYHRLPTWMQNHHIRMINSSIQTLFCFLQIEEIKVGIFLSTKKLK
jgi:hypothetical protein